MEQMDFFDKELEKEFKKLDSWMRRLKKRMAFLEHVYMRTRRFPIATQPPVTKVKQLDFFSK